MNQVVHSIYAVPYDRIPRNSSVVIYGAGKLGRHYVRSILGCGIVSIAGVIDGNPPQTEYAGITIRRPDSIQKIIFDYVLIAVESPQMASEMKNTLLELGVDEKVILWPGEQTETLSALSEYQKMLERNISEESGKFFMFMLPEHGNLGDYMIGYAEERFFQDHFRKKMIGITSMEWIKAKTEILNMVRPDDVLFLNGGGYIGDLWEGDRPLFGDIIESFPDNVKFFMPNTLTYKEVADGSNEVFLSDMEWFSKQKNLYTMFRERRSYEQFAKYNSRSFLFPDMAMSLYSKREETSHNGKVLLCLRKDREKVFGAETKLKQVLDKESILYNETDMAQDRYISQEEGRTLFAEMTRTFQNHECVITDRLHGMLLAVISDVPCLFFDNKTRKVSGVYEWFQNTGYARELKEIDFESLLSFIREAVADKERAGAYAIPYKQFEEMASMIRSVIQEEERSNERMQGLVAG